MVVLTDQQSQQDESGKTGNKSTGTLTLHTRGKIGYEKKKKVALAKKQQE